MVYVTWPAEAQEGGLSVGLDVEQGFTVGDNLELATPERGSTTLSTTSLGLNVDSDTRFQTFHFGIGGALRYGSTPSGSNLETGFVDPFAELSYTRESANARFSFDASYRESDVSALRSISDFISDDGQLQLPGDLSELQGTGTRQAYDTRLYLETGLNAPLGFRLQARANGVDYDNASLATLTPYDRMEVSATALFRFNPVTTGVLALTESRYSNDATAVDRKARTAEIGFDRELANDGNLSLRVGYTDGDPDNTGTVGDASGVTGSLLYSQPLTDGELRASYVLRRNASGTIDTVRVGRVFDLPLGSLSVDVGSSSIYGASPELVGGLTYVQETQAGSYSLRFNRDVIADANDEDRFTTTLSAQYQKALTAQSSISANLSYLVADGSTLSNEVEQTNLSLSYQYAVTQDWNLNTGVVLRRRDETTVGTAESSQLFLNIGRSFDLLR